MKTLVLILSLSSVVFAEDCMKKLPEGVNQYIPCDESAKWTSDEKPPKHQQPPWQTGEVKDTTLQNTDVAMRNPPDSCKKKAVELKVNCIWTGVQCLCNKPNDGKEP